MTGRHIDELQQVALARAAMMQRGHDHLQLIVGPEFANSLRHCDAMAFSGVMVPHNYGGPESVLGMTLDIRSGMEGFCVISASDPAPPVDHIT